jgi:GT2 family glycosyltransferase
LWRGGARGFVRKWRRPPEAAPVEAGTAAVVAVRTALAREVPLPEAYGLYWEELEWFWRLRERGARVLYLPAAAVAHAGGRADVRPESARLLSRNAVRCVRRTQGAAAAWRAYPVVLLWQARLLLQDAVRAAAGSRAARRRLPARRAGAAAALAAWRELR